MDGQTWTILAAMFATSATLAGLTVTAMHQLRTGLQVEIAGVRTELHATRAELLQGDVSTRTELKHDIADLRTELKHDIADLRTELKREIADTRTELKQELVEVREGLARVEQRTYELALNRPAS
jgi:hypothetical protein